MIVGIDLGTTNSSVAFINGEGKPEVIINERGTRLTPSVVHFKSEREVLVGELARHQLVLKPDKTVALIKRLMGTEEKVSIFGREYTPPQISALILRKLISYAEKYLGQKIEGAVITVPAYFNDNQRQATLMAGRLAGVNVVKLLNEPTAAALAYGGSPRTTDHVLVLDIGGGTFDITLMEHSEGTYGVVATGGSTSLGGVDFDRRLAQHILNNFELLHGINLAKDPIAYYQVLINAERAKIDLSVVEETSVLIPYITMSDNGPIHLNQVITRQEFETLCQDLWDSIKQLINDTFAQAGMTRDWVKTVVLAGGASRMAGFISLVKDAFPDADLKAEINPDEVVALGAAIEAGMYAGNIKNIELLDVTGFNLGIEDDNGDLIPIIAANTRYPVERSKLFTTVRDDQEEVVIHILQWPHGEDGEIVPVSLGRFRLSGIQPAPAGVPNIDVSFSLDRNGVLNVSAVDVDTGSQNYLKVTVNNASLTGTLDSDWQDIKVI